MKLSKNLKKHKFALISETVRGRAKRTHICTNFHFCCIFVQISILAAYFCKFHSGCIFVQTFILAAHLCKLPFLLHIYANFSAHILLCNVSFKLYNYANFTSHDLMIIETQVYAFSPKYLDIRSNGSKFENTKVNCYGNALCTKTG